MRVVSLLVSIGQDLVDRSLSVGVPTFAPIAGMTRDGLHSPILAVAVLLVLIGLFAFTAVLLRLV